MATWPFMGLYLGTVGDPESLSTLGAPKSIKKSCSWEKCPGPLESLTRLGTWNLGKFREPLALKAYKKSRTLETRQASKYPLGLPGIPGTLA